MSFIANCHNPATSAQLSESDHDDENEYDSSCNRQNETMMHKVKDVVSKLLNPSFLFSADNDTTRPKRKRSTSVEENDNNEQQTDTTTTNTTNGRTTTSQYHRTPVTNDGPQLTDDEDSNSRDVPSTEQDIPEIEQQKKRRRTANYQHILSTNSHEDVRTSSPSISTDSVRSLSNRRIDHTTNTTPIIFHTSTEHNYNERINRLTPSRQRSNILPTYRGSTSNYDPSKSPLFSVGNRRTTESTTTSNEFSANHLLASGLVSRSQPSTSNSQPNPATLSNPITNNRLLSNERQMLGVNYASINSRRLPYIERLRRRTLQDCIRLNRTLDSEPLSISTNEEHKSTTTTPVSKRTKAPEKDCGIQCDISIVEPNKKIQRTFPPEDIRNEALSVPIIEKIQSSSQTDPPMQTDSSITIEKIQPPIPIIEITKPKVLGNITPFSWPKFARAQTEFAKKYPEKCRDDALVPTKSIVPPTTTQSNVNISPTVLQQTNTSTGTIPRMPIFPFSSSSSSSSRPAEAIWKCPFCTKEQPAQTAFCSLCHGRNSDYKKLSLIEPTVTIEKEPVSSKKLSDVISKEPSISTPATTASPIIPTTTKENVSSIPPTVTTSAFSSSFPSFGTKGTTKENPPVTTSSTVPSFGTTPLVSPITTKENPVTTSASQPSFGITPIVSTSTITTTKENTTTISTPPSFSTASTKENPVTTSAPFTISTIPTFGVTTNVTLPTTTKENPVTTSTPFVFGTITTTSATSPFQVGTPFQPFSSTSSTNFTTAVSSSSIPSVITTTSGIPSSAYFGQFGTSPRSSITTGTPVVSTSSFNPTSSFTFAPTSSISSVTTSTATAPNFGSSSMTSTPTTTTAAVSIPMFPAASSFSSSSGSTLPTTTTTSVVPAFGTSSFSSFVPVSTTTTTTTISTAPAFGTSTFSSFVPTSTTTTTPSIPSFGLGASSPTRPFAPMSTPFGTSAPFGINPTVAADRPANTTAPFQFSLSSSQPTFGLGSTPATTTNPTPSSAPATGGFSFGSSSSTVPAAPTGGFSFAPPSSAALPVFGAGPPSLATVTPFPSFGLGGTSTAATSISPFVFSAPGTTANISDTFTPPVSSGSIDGSPNLFSIGSSDSSSTGQRQMLRAKRRQRP